MHFFPLFYIEFHKTVPMIYNSFKCLTRFTKHIFNQYFFFYFQKTFSLFQFKIYRFIKKNPLIPIKTGDPRHGEWGKKFRDKLISLTLHYTANTIISYRIYTWKQAGSMKQAVLPPPPEAAKSIFSHCNTFTRLPFFFFFFTNANKYLV